PRPRHYPRAAATARSGVPWAAGNDAFNGGWDEHAERRFLRMVQALSGLPGCLFVICSNSAPSVDFRRRLHERQKSTAPLSQNLAVRAPLVALVAAGDAAPLRLKRSRRRGDPSGDIAEADGGLLA